MKAFLFLMILSFPLVAEEVLSFPFGNERFTIYLPPGWKASALAKDTENEGSVYLYSADSQYGCFIDFTRYENKNEMMRKLASLKDSSWTDLKNGFKTTFWTGSSYACRQKGPYLVRYFCQSNDEALWNHFINCVSINTLTTENKPLVEDVEGWTFHCPQKHLQFETYLPIETKGINDHSISFETPYCSGFLTVRWKASNFKELLSDLAQETYLVEPNQRFDSTIEEGEGYAILRGAPYGLLAIQADDFMFAFTVRSTSMIYDYDINELIQRISWY